MLISDDAAPARLICYQNTLIQVLLSCANDLSFQVMTILVSIERPVVSANLRLHRGSSAARRHPLTARPAVLEARGSLNADHAGKASSAAAVRMIKLTETRVQVGASGGAVMPRADSCSLPAGRLRSGIGCRLRLETGRGPETPA